ncbi:hypothetical protein [Chitiniphilus shinanonensis]|uniref:hypothetical protein n=1 Tax=Chitiniphilus shinanonensis TaxID=553088 RepID=UPI00304EC2CC
MILIFNLLIVMSAIWVFYDATQNKIGRIPNQKGFTNLPAGGWAACTLGLWIVAFPVYLARRESLIRNAESNPVETSNQGLKFGIFIVLGVLVVLLTMTSEMPPSSATPVQTEAAQVTTTDSAIPPHNYSLRDGDEYGYELALSQDQKNSGQAMNPLIMFRFSGIQNGKYQIYHEEGSAFDVVECTKDCKFMKIMMFRDGRLAGKERVRVEEGVMAWQVMKDAINGHLVPYHPVEKASGRKLKVWFSEEEGVVATYL